MCVRTEGRSLDFESRLNSFIQQWTIPLWKRVTSAANLVFRMMREDKQATSWVHCLEFCAAANPSPAWTHSPPDTQVALGWCRAYSPHSADTEPARSFSGRVMVTGNWHVSTTMAVFFFFYSPPPAILLITLRAFWLDWNFSRRVLYMLSPSLCPSVCMVSLKIAIFPVKPRNC